MARAKTKEKNMHLSLSQEEEILGESLRKFALDHLDASLDASADPAQSLQSTRQALQDFGLWGLTAPDGVGGAGMGLVTAAIAIDELARRAPGVAALLAIQTGFFSSAALHLGLQETEHFSSILDGSLRLGLAIVDESAQDSEDPILAKGSPILAPADGLDAIFLISGGAAPLLQFIPTDGLSFSQDLSLGLNALSRVSLQKDLRLSNLPSHLLRDREVLGELFASLSLAIAAVALGIGSRALQEGRSYASEREQFGKSLDRFQAIQFKLADMATALETSRWLIFRAAADPTTELSTAALTASMEAAFLCADEALQIHGGYGYTREYPVEFLYRDAVELQRLAASLKETSRQ